MIALLYFSGTGGTELVARLLARLLADRLEGEPAGAAQVDVSSVNAPGAAALASTADFLVLCYPTYYLRPAPSMREFIEGLGPLEPRRAAYVVTTYELYAENSIRASALSLAARGVHVVGWKAVRAPGSDATCVLPPWLAPWLFRFERRFPRRLRDMAAEIAMLAAESRAGDSRTRTPSPKWYTPLAQALQILALNRFDAMRWKFRILGERCELCGACVSLCIRGALSIAEGALRHEPERCELCTRCIHRCPRRAIVLLDVCKDNPRLDPSLYATLRAEAETALARLSPARPGARSSRERAYERL